MAKSTTSATGGSRAKGSCWTTAVTKPITLLVISKSEFLKGAIIVWLRVEKKLHVLDLPIEQGKIGKTLPAKHRIRSQHPHCAALQSGGGGGTFTVVRRKCAAKARLDIPHGLLPSSPTFGLNHAGR